ncbi:hemicentin-1-like [Pecten maximus]|uniref:hemicentin-1-like n=1 Tax=Pecten maximus TaxID=6579 RepID=UPI001458DAD9|nr:hemicentin-1-like [Pecten maximus]
MTQPGSSLSTNHPLTIYLIPTAYVAEQNPVAEIGTFHVLTCNVDTVLTATVTWYKTGSAGDVTLQNNVENYVIGDRTLSFSPVILEHEGRYMCSASNDAGTSGISPPVNLIVYQLPGVPALVFPSTAVEGQITRVNATSYGGYPAPALTWERNGVVVDNTYTTDGSITYNSYSFSASLADIKVPFKANATNAFGVLSASNALADVYAPASPPGIEGADLAYEGTPVTFQCFSARARPAPALYWRYGDTDMTSQATQSTFNNPDLVTVRTTSNLTFIPAPGDEGKQLICILHQPNARDTNLSIVLNLNSYPDLKPRVSLESTATDVRIGTDKTLRCRTVSVLPATVLWFVDNLQISPSANYAMSGEYLTIVDFDTSDNGAYSCISQNDAGSSNQTGQLVLTAYAPPGLPTITQMPTSVPNENEIVSLTCNTSNGVPSPNITWTKNGTTLFNNIITTATETLVSSTLTFVANYVNDKGAVFRCTTMNEFRTQSTSLTISSVNVLPTQAGTTIVGDSTVYEGRTSYFYCENGRTLPTASVTWILGQEILVGQTSYVDNSDGTWKVSSNLTHIVRYSDSGTMNLICRVTHTTGYSINKTLQLYGYSKPRVSISNPSVTVAKGLSLKLHCVVVSELGAMVTWYKSSTGAILTSTVLYTFNGPNVTINSVAVGDEGGYYCTARNDAGNSTNSNIFDVTVYAHPVKPVITGLERSVTENTLLTINCTSADGYPLPVIRWYRNGSLIWTAPAGLHSSYSFQVAFSDRETWYTCTATNFYNNATSDPTKIPDVYLLPSGVSLIGPSTVYQTKMSVFLCTVSRVSPNPSFRWLVGSAVKTSSSNVTATTGGNVAISSYFSHVFDVSDMGKNISCTVTQVETNTTVTRSQSVILHLLPTVQNIARSANVELYTNPTVTCVVSSTDSNFSVTWYKNGVAIDTAGSGGKYSTTKTVLTITSFQESDSGLYTCRASHQGGSSGMSLPTNLTGFEYPFKPEITSNHPTRIVVEGVTLLLNCSTTGGVPVPALTWKRGTSNVIIDATSTSTVGGSGTLVFNEYSSTVAFSDNSSVYVCEAKNPHLTVISTFILLDVYVTPAPTVMHSPVLWDESNAIASFYEDQTYIINGSIPRYNPKSAVFYWLINNIIQTPKHTAESVTDEMVFAYTSAIEVLMSKDLDGGKVTFMVQHPETTSSNVSFTIKILNKPRVSFPQTSGQVLQNENFPVTCNVSSSLDYNVTWKIKGNNTRLANSAKYLITGARGQTLTIINANFTDSVNYVCTAMNSAGEAVEAAEFYLIVYREVGQPVMTGFDRFVVHGTAVSIFCNSSGGAPPATLSWEKNGAPLTAPTPTYGNDNTNPVSSVLTFVVDFVTDQNAVFKCTASNSFSSRNDQKSFQDVHIFSNSMTLSGTEPTTMTAGTLYTFHSHTSGMYPIPQVLWFINNIRQYNGIVIENESEKGTYRTNSSFSFTPSRNDNGHQAVCVFDHTLQTGRSINASRTLNVQSPE